MPPAGIGGERRGDAEGGPGRDGTPARGPGCACAAGNEFSAREAQRDLDDYRQSGPDRTTRWLLEGLTAGGVDGLTVLDIGAGVGAVHLELLRSGAASAVDVDGSPAFVDAAVEEARRQGVTERVDHLVGDFVGLAPEILTADLVALDRVVCCYPDVGALVGLSAARAGRRYGLVYPRDAWWIRSGGTAFNGVLRLFRRRLRFYIHPTADVEAIVVAAGLRRSFHRTTRFWQVSVFERVGSRRARRVPASGPGGRDAIVGECVEIESRS